MTKLQAYAQYFPELFGGILQSVDIESSSVEDLYALANVCKETVLASTQIHTAPNLVENLINGMELSILNVAANSDDDTTRQLINLRGLSKAIKSDPIIASDLKFISIDLLDWVPSNPYIRLGMNIAKVGYGVFMHNAYGGKQGSEPSNSEKFSEF